MGDLDETIPFRELHKSLNTLVMSGYALVMMFAPVRVERKTSVVAVPAVQDLGGLADRVEHGLVSPGQVETCFP